MNLVSPKTPLDGIIDKLEPKIKKYFSLVFDFYFFIYYKKKLQYPFSSLTKSFVETKSTTL